MHSPLYSETIGKKEEATELSSTVKGEYFYVKITC